MTAVTIFMSQSTVLYRYNIMVFVVGYSDVVVCACGFKALYMNTTQGNLLSAIASGNSSCIQPYHHSKSLNSLNQSANIPGIAYNVFYFVKKELKQCGSV